MFTQNWALSSPCYSSRSFTMFPLCQYSSSQSLYWATGYYRTTQPGHTHCRWRVIGPAGRALYVLCVCVCVSFCSEYLREKCSFLNYPLPQGRLRFWRSPISLFPSALLLLIFSSFKNLLSLFLFHAVSNDVFHPAVKHILQTCLKFPKVIPFPPTLTK